MKTYYSLLLCLGLSVAQAATTAPATSAPASTISLAGDWRIALDASAEQTRLGGGRGAPAQPLVPGDGLTQEWFKQPLPGTSTIKLPGILQAQGYGNEISASTPWVGALGQVQWARGPLAQRYSEPGKVKVGFTSQPPRHYLGVAWFQRDIDIPAAWQGQDVSLFLERVRWETSVWVDDKPVGSNNSLVAPHVYDLGILAPGKHRLTIRDDNRMLLPYRGDGHSVSDSQGSTWNGIAGRLELIAHSPVYIDDAQVFTDIAKKTALIKVKVANATGQPGSGNLSIGRSYTSENVGEALKITSGASAGNTVSAPVTWDATGGTAEIEVPLGPDAKLWDEFHPNLQHLTLNLQGTNVADSKLLTFGLRQITWNDKDLFLNGRLIEIRGTHDGGDFPLTGYPPTDVASWAAIFQVCKDYGFNAMRFHSWCPPDAAFTAADEMGFYLAPEPGFWDGFSPGSAMSRQLDAESERLVKAFGNHPSFIMMSPANETTGGYLPTWVTAWYQRDPRRLYAYSTGNDSAAHFTSGAQYASMPHTSTAFPGSGGQLRTSSNANAVWFGGDYRDALQNVHIPMLAHELGQWCAYPDFDMIKDFTGYLRPANYEIFRDLAAEHGVLDRNKEFAWASGRFQLACYKAEIEANRRTPGMSGYQLLDLHDYLGQGTALIGVVDSFWKPKSYVTGAEYARFAGATAPLARLSTHVGTTAEPFTVPVEIAHYGPEPLAQAKPYWKIVDLAGKTMMEGQLATLDIPIGKNISLGTIAVNPATLPAPRQYKLVVGLTGTKVENDWNIWIYPAQVDPAVPADVLATSDWNAAQTRLAAGGKVLFTPTARDLGADSPPLDNVPVFWNRMMNPKTESMLGIWADAKHPALAGFPTEANCDWQWTDMMRTARAVNIERAPAALKPIVSAVDDWNRNWKLGLIFESQVGPGKLMVSSINLDAAGVGPRQLRRSLLDYMASPQFQPTVAMMPSQAGALWGGVNAPPVPGALPPGTPPPDIDEGPSRPATPRVPANG